jgi:hypothetical protein
MHDNKNRLNNTLNIEINNECHLKLEKKSFFNFKVPKHYIITNIMLK